MNLRLFTTFILALSFFQSFAQQVVFEGQYLKNAQHQAYADQFTQYQVFEIDAAALNAYAKSGAIDVDFRLKLGNSYDWDFSITPHDIRAENYSVRAQTDKGVIEMPRSENKTFRGALAGSTNSLIALTLDTDFIYGFVKTGQDYVFIEPAWYFNAAAPKNHFVIYRGIDMIPKKDSKCGAMELAANKKFVEENHKHKHDEKTSDDMKSLACFQVELAIASDAAMFADYGSVTGVENHNIGVNNNVETDYDTDFFANEIQFAIVEQFIVTNGNNPWPAGTGNPDAGDYLDDFTAWGQGGGFTANFDLGSLWTGLDLAGTTIGVAWLSAVCGFNKYNLLQDFTSNATFLRVMVSHEYGHNFSCQHDDSGSSFIMAPSVNNTATWSTQSVNSVNAFVSGLSCLSACGPPIPPAADFMANYSSICTGSMVTFIDQSTNNPTSWNWSFPGGTPSSSTEQSPTVTYNNAGNFTVTLTVSNGNGSNTTSQSVSVGSGTDFFHFTTFENGLNGWTIENPAGDAAWTPATVTSSRYGNVAMGIDNYNTNNVGSRDALVSPTLDFSGRSFINLDFDYAYARYDNELRDSMVVYVSTNNGASYTRVFAATENGGGDFATAPQQTNEFVPDDSEWCFSSSFGPGCMSLDISAFAGSSQAKIKIENVNGYGNNMYVDNIAVSSDCQLNLPPIAQFSSNDNQGCVPFSVSFTDESINGATSWNWSFPGGTPNSSTQQNPTITYSTPGIYDVSLSVTNASGTDATTQFGYISVEDVPFVDFDYVVNGLSVDFNNLTNTTGTYSWDFGDNTSSSQENPSHTYTQGGTYEVVLEVANNCGFDAIQYIIDLEVAPIASFEATETSGCLPFEVQFSDLSQNSPTAWSWVFEGGNPATSNAQNPMVTYNSVGNFDVTLTVTNGAGMDETIEFTYITVEDVPTADFSPNVNGSGVDFFNNSTGGTTYVWDFGDGMGTSTDEEPFYLYNADGIYFVTLEATNDCGTDIFTETVTISNVPNNANFSANTNIGCVGETIAFFDNSPDNVTSWFWSFEGGTPATSTMQNPTVVYNSAGTFDVTLDVSNAAGTATNTEVNFITIGEAPTAGFTSIVTDLTADFTNASTNAATYAWTFGDGTGTSSEENPSYTYGADGTYTVTLVVTNPCGSETSTQIIEIATPPSAGFLANSTSGCAPLSVLFTNQSSANASTYLWTFDGGEPATSTEQNPTVVYNNAGVFDVTLTVSNGTGDDTSTQTSLISVSDVPVVDFMSLANDQTVDFTNLTTNATSLMWDFGDNTGTSTEENPTYTYAADGIYDVVLTATNACGTNNFTMTVMVSTLPQAFFEANTTTGCAPLEVQFMDMSSANTTSWNWSFPGGMPSSSTEQNPTVTYSMSGTYNVTLIATNGSGENTFMQTDYIVVNDTPTVGFTSLGNNQTVEFTSMTTNATSISWDFGDNTGTSTEANPTYTYAADGIYDVILTATNACGTNTFTMTVTVSTLPQAAFGANTTTGCAPLEVQFMDMSSANTTSWNWLFPGGTPSSSTEQNPTVTYSMAGSYDVTLTATNSEGENVFMQTAYIVVNDEPTASFSEMIDEAMVTFTNNSTNATSFAWDFGDNTGTSTEENPTYTYGEDGTYTVMLTVTNDCGSVTSTETVVIVTPPTPMFSAAATTACEGEMVQFSDESSENATSWNWTFEGGTPATSTDQNPLVTYNTAGLYSVTLEVSNAAGMNSVTQMNFITVNALPSGDFSTATINADVSFTNSVANANSFAWDFGDNMGTSTETNPDYTYMNDGTYTVTLTATNDCGTFTTTEEVTIVTPPSAGFIVMTTTGCEPFEVEFMNQSSANAVSYLWTFEGGSPATSTEENPVVLFENPGTFTVTLTVTNAAGEDTFEDLNLITVNGLPQPDFTFITTDQNVAFNNTSNNATSYLWDFGDNVGTSTEENPTYDFTADGVYTVTLTANNDCGDVETTELIVIATEAPIAAFEVEDTEGCAPFVVTFENLSSENATSYLWTFDGGVPATSTDENPTVTYNNLGVYDVTLVATNALGSNTYEQLAYIEVNEETEADFDFSIFGTTVSFNNLSTAGTSFQWFFGNSITSMEENPEHVYAQSGIYEVTLVANGFCGPDTLTQQVNVVVEAPLAAFNAMVREGCAPFETTFTDLSTGNPTNYEWTFVGGTPAMSNQPNPTVIYNEPGVYDVSLTVGSPGGSHTFLATQYIAALDLPTAEFTFEDTELAVDFTNISIGGDSFFWDFGDNSTSTSSSPAHLYDEPGTYTVTLSVTNDCGVATFTEMVTVILDSVEDLPGLEQFQVFPNPNTGQFTLVMQGQPLGMLEVKFYNIIGQQLFIEQLDFQTGQLTKHFDFAHFAKGVYVLEIGNGNNAIFEKVVIE